MNGIGMVFGRFHANSEIDNAEKRPVVRKRPSGVGDFYSAGANPSIPELAKPSPMLKKPSQMLGKPSALVFFTRLEVIPASWSWKNH
jgi:hypothetical protein